MATGCSQPADPPSGTPTPAATQTRTPTATPTATPSDSPADVEPDASAMLTTVRHLAGRIGPREATSAAYSRAADYVARRFAELGLDVREQRFRVPRGVSWGVPVPAGRSWNVVATPPGYRPGDRHVVVGAHLDTVPQAPGAEDNASGIAVLLELARLHKSDPPVVFVAFGAEEPRGAGDLLHHFGSRHYVSALGSQERAAVQAMVSLDRVGIARVVPVCTGGLGPRGVRDALAAAARRVGVRVRVCADNRASDHWSFEQSGVPAARVGSTPYAGYHSAADRPGVVRPAALRRTAEVVLAWLRGAPGARASRRGSRRPADRPPVAARSRRR